MTNARAFGTWIGKHYPGLLKILGVDTNSYWTNKSAMPADYQAGGVQPMPVFTDYSDVYDELAAGLRAGEGDSAMITVGFPESRVLSGFRSKPPIQF